MWERAALGEFYVSLLKDRLGLPAVADEDHDVSFEVQGNRLWVMNPGPHDPGYVRILLSVRVGSATPEALLAASLKANHDWKGVKVSPSDGVVTLSYEAFEANGHRPDPQHLAEVLPRVIDAILEAAREIVQDLAA